MNKQQIYKVILGPHTTEKTSLVADSFRHIVFKVAINATKKQITEAVKTLFDVKVKTVRVVKVKGKVKRFKQRIGSQSDFKKAYVALEEGFDINLANFE